MKEWLVAYMCANERVMTKIVKANSQIEIVRDCKRLNEKIISITELYNHLVTEEILI